MKLSRKDYKQIAKKHGVTVDDVKREMQEAINAAYINPTFNAKCVPCVGDVPTVDEFIEYVANRIRLEEIGE